MDSTAHANVGRPGAATSGGGLGHIAQLDGVRAIAVAVVFVAHCGFGSWVPGGLGVTVFFFLSGYLITTLLRSEWDKDGFIDLIQFYIRRTLRIWPPLYITLAFNALLAVALNYTDRISAWGTVAQLGFVINYVETLAGLHGIPYAPLWSLAVEEHFYLLFPLIFIALVPRGPRAIGYACMIGCAIALVIRLLSIRAGVSFDEVYEWSHTRYDSILFGCVLALWQNPMLDKHAWRPSVWHFAGAIGLILLTLVIRNPVAQQTIRYTLQGIALFVIFSYILVDTGLITRLLTLKPLRLLGVYSYTFYLSHQAFIALIEALGVTRPIPVMILAFPLTWVFCWGMYRMVEQPTARWRRSLRRTDRNATAVAP